jgi:Domain of unknown function (DUF4105)
MKYFRWFCFLLLGLPVLAWAFGALHFDGPSKILAWAFAGLNLAVVMLVTPWLRKIGLLGVGFVVVLIWWFALKPTGEAKWQADVAQKPWAEIHGDEVTVHHVRNFDYRTATDATPVWETRTVRLSKLTHMDLFINYWGSPWMAHPIVSFQFAEGPPLCFSIETRKKVGQNYSAIGGLYRQYELIFVAADERDAVRVRTNYREGEDVYLYRTAAGLEHIRERFLEYIDSINQLHEKPRWYNAITTNCTTAIRSQRPSAGRQPWDWRMLVNGKGDEMLYERGAILTDSLPFAELKRRAHINAAARDADDSPDFSRIIRENRPGFHPAK